MKKLIASLQKGVIRPRDAKKIYTQPALQFRRLEREGVLLKLAHGYYAHIPEAMRGTVWRPEMEALALGIGQADYDRDDVALMHISAARIHGAIPRALAVAVLAVPKRRPALVTKYGRIVFVQREVNGLKKIRVNTGLIEGWCTGIEQTAMDLANRPNLVKGLDQVSRDAAISLLARSNDRKLKSVVNEQRMGTASARMKEWLKDA